MNICDMCRHRNKTEQFLPFQYNCLKCTQLEDDEKTR